MSVKAEWKRFKDDMSNDWKKTKRNIKEDNQRTQEKHEMKMQQLREERKQANELHRAKMAAIKENQQNEPKESETEKLASTGNFLVRGIALWYLLPLLGVLLIVGIFAAVWIWDMITGLF